MPTEGRGRRGTSVQVAYHFLMGNVTQILALDSCTKARSGFYIMPHAHGYDSTGRPDLNNSKGPVDRYYSLITKVRIQEKKKK